MSSTAKNVTRVVSRKDPPPPLRDGVLLGEPVVDIGNPFLVPVHLTESVATRLNLADGNYAWPFSDLSRVLAEAFRVIKETPETLTKALFAVTIHDVNLMPLRVVLGVQSERDRDGSPVMTIFSPSEDRTPPRPRWHSLGASLRSRLNPAWRMSGSAKGS